MLKLVNDTAYLTNNQIRSMIQEIHYGYLLKLTDIAKTEELYNISGRTCRGIETANNTGI